MNATGLFLLPLLLVPTLAVTQGDPVETTELGDGVYRFRYTTHAGFFVVTDEGVVAFDPLSVEAARAFAAEIQRVAPGAPLAAVVYSHDHADHATGAAALIAAFGAADVPIIAHERAREPIEQRADPDQPVPTLTFSDRLDLHFGGRQIELHYLGANHSDNSIVALVSDARIAFAVDFVSHDRMGYQDLSSFIFPDQFVSLRRLRELPFDVISFGHGNVGDKASVIRQIRYYDDLRAAAEAAVADGLTEDEAVAHITLPAYADWEGFNWFEGNVRGMYRWAAGQ